MVSIHAPTRGATSVALSPSLPLKCFDPRPHARGDARQRHHRGGDLMFRSTPPREGRLDIAASCAHPITFRSTPPREGRRVSVRVPRGMLRFRSTPPREGRLNGTSAFSGTWLFRSTPPREGRLRTPFVSVNKIMFRSTPPREGRLPYRNLLIFRQKSTSRREACKQSKFLPSG